MKYRMEEIRTSNYTVYRKKRTKLAGRRFLLCKKQNKK
jgi:hypothetical protein